MDPQQVPQTPIIQPQVPQPFSKLPLILGTIILVVIVGLGAYYLGKSSNKEVVQNVQTSPSSIQAVSPTGVNQVLSPTSSQTSISSIPLKSTSNIENIKKKLEYGKKIYIEVIDQSPTDKNIFAYGANPENYSEYGIYLYNDATGQLTTLWKFSKSVVGRGGIYKDNLELKFASDGNALFLNKTGTNTPSLLILKTDGTIIYQSDSDLGHPTWLSAKEILFVKTDTNSPYIFDINTKQTETTNLPKNIYGLKINSSGSRLLSYVLDPQPLNECQVMDLIIFSYPEGKKLATIKNVLRSMSTGSWVSDNAVTYREVTGCKDQDMFPTPLYSDYKQFNLP